MSHFITEREFVLVVNKHENYMLFFDIENCIWNIYPRPGGIIENIVGLHGVLDPGYNDLYLQFAGVGILSVDILEPWLHQTYEWTKYTDLNVEYHVDHEMSHIADSMEQGQGQGQGPGPIYTCALVPMCLRLTILHLHPTHPN